MIREFRNEDYEQLTKIVKKGLLLVGHDNIDFIVFDSNKLVVYEDNDSGLLGFSSIKIWGNDKKNGEVFTYVIPGSRRQGIGTQLYDETMRYAHELKLNFVDIAFRHDKDDATPFYRKLGYEKWYGLHDMHYCGSAQPVTDMNLISYENKYFEPYAEGMSSSFYEMRRIHDFRPHLCCALSKEKREELLNNKDNIFMLLVNGMLTASVKVNNNGSLGDVFVLPLYQGKGYGRIIMQFGINEALHRGMKEITLDVVEWNARALKLYLSLGFEIIQTTHYYRLFNV